MSAAEPSRSRSAGGRVCLSSNQRTSPMENGQWNHTNMQLMSNTPTGIYPTKIEIYAIPNTIDLEKLEQKHHQPRAAEIKPLGDTYPNHSQTAVMIVNAFTLCYSSVARCGNGKSPLNEGLNGRNIYIIRVDLDCFAYCPESIPIEPKKNSEPMTKHPPRSNKPGTAVASNRSSLWHLTHAVLARRHPIRYARQYLEVHNN